MKKLSVTTLFAALLAVLLVPYASGQGTSEEPGTKKIAQTGFKFLSVSTDARSAAVADAMTAHAEGNSIAMFYNPASMAFQTTAFHVAAGMTQWIADINYNAASFSVSPGGGTMGVFGFSLVSADYGDLIGTVRSDGVDDGYLETGEFQPTALSVGVGYARALTDRFAVGGNVKYVSQDFGAFQVGSVGENVAKVEEYAKSAVAFDFGVLYKTGFQSLNFAMSVRNFAQELKYVSENFELPLTFRIGVSMNLMDLTSMDRNLHSLVLAVDAERPRDFAEQLKIGGEYTFMNLLALRAGYVFPTDEQGVNLGVGLRPRVNNMDFGFDYAYTSFGIFDAVHRLSVQFGF